MKMVAGIEIHASISPAALHAILLLIQPTDLE
jgi:hypothetical protein